MAFLPACSARRPRLPVPHSQPLPPNRKLNVLFGSQSGNAESIAKRLVKEAKKQGYEATIAALEKASPAALAQEKCALIVTSTWGEGDPPDNAVKFWEQLKAENDLKLCQFELFRPRPG